MNYLFSDYAVVSNLAARFVRDLQGICLLHTPVLMHQSKNDLTGIWMGLEYHLDDGENQITPLACRYVFSFQRKEGHWEVKGFEREIFTSLDALSISKSEKVISEDLPEEGCCDEDYWKVSNLQNHYVYSQGKQLSAGFAKNIETSYYDVFLDRVFQGTAEIEDAQAKLNRMIKENGGTLGWYSLSSPEIVVSEDQQTAKGRWNTYGFVIRGQAYGAEEKTKQLDPFLGILEQTFVKEDGKWKWKTFHHKRLVTFSNWKFTPGRAVGSGSPNIGLIQLQKEGEWPESGPLMESQISGQEFWEMAQIESWDISALNSGKSRWFVERYYSRDRDDISSYTASPKAEKRSNYSEILKEAEWYESLRRKQGNSQSYHSATTPLIQASQDGKRAKARWLDIGWTIHGRGMSKGDPPFPVVPVFGMYEHDLVRENGRWKVHDYRFYALLQMHSWYTDPDRALGWSSLENRGQWPMPV